MADANTPFLMNPTYSRYELGVVELDPRIAAQRSPPAVSVKTARTWAGVLGFLVIILYMLATSRAESKTERLELSLELTVNMITALVPILLAALILNRLRPSVRQRRSEYQRLRHSWRIVDGELVSLEWRGGDYSWYNYLRRREETWVDNLIIAQYKFVSPSTGRVLTGWVKRERSDLKGSQLPPAGTRIRVLYADDEAHVML